MVSITFEDRTHARMIFLTLIVLSSKILKYWHKVGGCSVWFRHSNWSVGFAKLQATRNIGLKVTFMLQSQFWACTLLPWYRRSDMRWKLCDGKHGWWNGAWDRWLEFNSCAWDSMSAHAPFSANCTGDGMSHSSRQWKNEGVKVAYVWVDVMIGLYMELE
jgi:hypothetical protein